MIYLFVFTPLDGSDISNTKRLVQVNSPQFRQKNLSNKSKSGKSNLSSFKADLERIQESFQRELVSIQNFSRQSRDNSSDRKRVVREE